MSSQAPEPDLSETRLIEELKLIVQDISTKDNRLKDITGSHNPYIDWPSDLSEGFYQDLNILLKRLGSLRSLLSCDITTLKMVGTDSARIWSMAHPSGSRQFEVLREDLEATKERIRNGEYMCSRLDILGKASAEIIQCIGYNLNITPSFFDAPSSIIHTDNRTNKNLFFSLQFMSDYEVEEYIFAAEAARQSNSPKYVFKKESRRRQTQWRLSRISLYVSNERKRGNAAASTTSLDETRGYYCLLLIDPADTGMTAEAIEYLTDVGAQNRTPLPKSHHIINVISCVFYSIAKKYAEFLKEAEEYLQQLSQSIISTKDQEESSESQGKVTTELHQILEFWTEVKRRIESAESFITNLPEHAFMKEQQFRFKNAEVDLDGTFRKIREMLRDRRNRIQVLKEKTKTITNMALHLENLRESRAAIREARAANDLAKNVQKITNLTFIYLPVTLAATIYGMNLRPITGDTDQGNIWAFIGLSAGLFAFTIVALLVLVYGSEIFNSTIKGLKESLDELRVPKNLVKLIRQEYPKDETVPPQIVCQDPFLRDFAPIKEPEDTGTATGTDADYLNKLLEEKYSHLSLTDAGRGYVLRLAKHERSLKATTPLNQLESRNERRGYGSPEAQGLSRRSPDHMV